MKKPVVYAVIPARGGSKRLPRKNVQMLWGKPLIYWAVRACQQSSYISECYVSTEDDEIASLAEQFGAKLIRRPAQLAGDAAFKQDVIVHAAESFAHKPDLVVSVQANSPEVRAADLDAAIAKLIENDRSEIFSVDESLLQNAAFRVMKYDYVFQKSLSTYCGVFVTRYVDVHTMEDIQFLEQNSQPSDR
ncbi:MAG: 2-C-methyl-D-erythritol 4-phosphate cytidylyltransferase [Anaerolineales bacterium]|nr:2-C-methyl-D-erythritol 4-phosphate cytidylyltransferase [Anaerolineales bacterium]MCW5855424.1 2-C-methyl-D-erythritol 4-phosphate cytidylyltransferase [Anaerolineales bacterium]